MRQSLLIVAALVAFLALPGCLDLDQLRLEAEQLRQDIAAVDAKIAEQEAANPGSEELAALRGFQEELGEKLDVVLTAIETAPDDANAWAVAADALGAGLSAAVPSAAGPIGVGLAILSSIFAVRERRRTDAVVGSVDAATMSDESGRKVLDTAILAKVQEAAGVRNRVRKARTKSSS